MKKTLLLAAVLLPGVLLAQSEPTQNTEVNVSSGGNINRDCRGGTGRCNRDIITKSGGESTVVMRKINENQVVLSIHKNEFSQAEQQQVFREMLYVITENVPIEEAILQKLGISPNRAFLAKGSYPVQFNNDRFDVVISLSEK